MSNDKAVSAHYAHGDLLNAIRTSLEKAGRPVDRVTIADLAPVDEFHIGGRQATERFLAELNFSENDHVLDVGCGIGGAARYAADKYNIQVTGVDLTPEYIETGRALCAWVRLDGQVTLRQGSALAMPFQDRAFDGGYMMHVGMNIPDKARLFSEISRVLRPGAAFGVYDVMRIKDGELAYPVPWAAEKSASSLGTPGEYRQFMVNAGFDIGREANRREFALEFFRQLRASLEAEGGPPPLGLHTLMKEGTVARIKNLVDGISAGYVAPVEIIARKS